MRKRMFFFDIDGTLIDIVGEVPIPTAATVQCFQQLHAQGDYVILATGRARAFIPPEVMALGFDGFILSNGGYVSFQDTVVSETCISMEEMMRLDTYAAQAGAHILFIEQECAHIKDMQTPRLREFLEAFAIWNTGLCVSWELGRCRPNMANMVFENAESIERFKSLAGEEFDVFVFKDSGFMYADVAPKGVSKGQGVEQLTKKLDIARHNTYAFGDGMNDIQMFQNVGSGYAMGCARERVKRAARFTTGTCKDDGIFTALVHCGAIEGTLCTG